MNRTIKFQLSNIKKSFLFAALISYGAVALFYLIAILFDPAALSDFSAQPLWLSVLSLVAGPFTFLPIMYALWDGLMFFDTGIRFGVSRNSYFITQVVVYIILAIIMSFATGMAEIAWTGNASSFFAELGGNYLSLGNLIGEFLKTMALAIGMLAVYRFKAKAFVLAIILIGPMVFILSVIVFDSTQNTFFSELVINTATLGMENKEISIALLTTVVVGIYYLFITKTEVQD